MSSVAIAEYSPNTPPVQIEEVDNPLGKIIPQPNSGLAPTDPGHRGGSLQLTLLALIITFFTIAIFLIRRNIRNARNPEGL